MPNRFADFCSTLDSQGTELGHLRIEWDCTLWQRFRGSVSATTSKQSACLAAGGSHRGIKLAVSDPAGGNRRPDDETPGL